MKTHTARTIELLESRWITALECAQLGGCLSLSQRVGQFRRLGISVSSRWVRTQGGRGCWRIASKRRTMRQEPG